MTHAIEVKDLSLTVDEGEVISVIGPSGSGKSTLARCIARLEKINSGEIYVYGHRMDSEKMSNAKESELLGMIFQQFNLFPHLNVLENVVMAQMKVRGRSRAEAEEKRVNCSTKLVWPTKSTRCRRSFPAVSSSALPSPAPWRLTQKSCCLTSPRQPSIPNSSATF